MTDWARVIRAMAPRARSDIAAGIAEAMDRIIRDFEVNTPLRQAHFLAQCAHESDGFRTTVEYASGAAYEGRKDLGNTKKGDGKRFKGRGLIQTTGRANYKKVSDKLGYDFIADPEKLAALPYAVLSAAVFWGNNHLNDLADQDDVRKVTRKVNGGYNGLQDRTNYLAKAKTAIAGNDTPVVRLPPPRPAILDEEPLPREKVKALQERLTLLGYRCGAADGVIGTATVGAISSFQHDNELPITGRMDPATEEKLWHSDAEEKPVTAARANSTPQESRILDGAATLQKGAGAAVAGTGAVAVTDPIQHIEGASQAISRVQGALTPFKPLIAYAQDHWYVGVAIAAAVVWYFASRIKQARVDDHRAGKTL